MRNFSAVALALIALVVFAQASYAQKHAGGLNGAGRCNGYGGGIVQPRQVTRAWNIPGGVYIENAWQFGRRHCGPNPHARPDYYQRQPVWHYYRSVFSDNRYLRNSTLLNLSGLRSSNRPSAAERMRASRLERKAKAEERRKEEEKKAEEKREQAEQEAAGMEESTRPFAAGGNALMDAGRTALDEGRLDDAVALFRDACTAAPQHDPARAWLAVAASLNRRDVIATVAINQLGSVDRVLELTGGISEVASVASIAIAAEADDQSAPARLRASLKRTVGASPESSETAAK